MVWWVSAALAGSVFVNGTNVDGLRSQTFENCVVTIDSQGNVLITAPGYQIQVEGGATGASTTTPTAPPPPPPPPPPAASGVAAGQWWLVTEDNGSLGHTVDVILNGVPVRTVRSNDAQIILDLGPWLKPGANQVKIVSNSVNAGGGSMYVYIGTGSNTAGTVELKSPPVQFGLGSSRSGTYARDYTIDVAP